MTSVIKVDQIQNAAGGTPTAGDLGLNVSGSVLQVVNKYSDNKVSTGSTSIVVLDTLSVTPKATGSNFAVQFFLQGNWTNYNHGFGAFMYRDGSEICRSGNRHSVYTNTLTDAYLGGAWNFIDNTGSTAGTAISFQLRAQPYSANTLHFSNAGQTRGFIITEIAG